MCRDGTIQGNFRIRFISKVFFSEREGINSDRLAVALNGVFILQGIHIYVYTYIYMYIWILVRGYRDIDPKIRHLRHGETDHKTA